MNTNKMEFGEPKVQRQILTKSLLKENYPMSKSRTTSESDVTTIEESLKAIYLQGEDVTSKTHVAVLQEIVRRYGAPPNYELVRIDGMPHQPIFKYRVWINGKYAIGDGRSKKEAKQSAAKAIIDKLIGIACDSDTTTTWNSDATDDFNSCFQKSLFGNEISWLQELCVSRRLPPPLYEIDLEEGPRNDRHFSISCIICERREVGHGTTKKIAKRSAAQKMYKMLKNNSKGKDDGFFELQLTEDELL